MRPPSKLRLLLAVLLVVAAACGGSGSPEAADGSGRPDEIGASARIEPLPPVDLGRVEGTLRTRIESLRASLDEEPDADPVARGRRWGELGTLFHICELLEAAETAYRNASHLASKDERWPYYLAMIHQTRGELPEAETHFERALALAPDDLAARLRLGEVQLRSSRLDDALGSFSRVLELAPDSAAARYGLGRLAAIRGEPRQAVSTFEAVLALQPEATEVHYPLALEYRKLGDETKSRSHLALRGGGAVRFPDPLADRLSETKTRNAFDMVSTLAADVEELGDEDFFGFALEQVASVDGAAGQLRKQIEDGPPEAALPRESRWRARMHYVVGGLEARSGADAAAAEQFRAALALEPALADAGLRLGNALARMGRFGDAVEAYSRVLETVAFDREALLRRSTALLELDRLDEAVRDLEALVAADPRDGMAHSRLGAARARAGNQRAARAAFEQALAAELSVAERSLAHRQLARLLTGTGEPGAPAEALPHLRAVVALEPERLESRLDLAGTLARLERYPEALREYDQALALEEGHLGAQVDRARTLIRLGRDSEALHQLEAAASRSPGRTEPALLLARLLAASQDDTVRDGSRALAIAGALFKAEQSVPHGEALAMALAETGRFEEAAALQSQLLSAAPDLGSGQRQRLSEALARYRRGLPTRLP